jgi:hypothetical protein
MSWIFTLKTDENDTGVLRLYDDRGPCDRVTTGRPVRGPRVRREWFQQHNPCFGARRGRAPRLGRRAMVTGVVVSDGGDRRRAPR